MKAFIAVALLVAVVGAQELKLKNFQPHLIPTRRFTGQEEGIGGKLYRELPYESAIRELENERQLNKEHVTVLSLQELYNTELFREYLNIPLFNQWIQQTIFQRYIASPLFQQLWTTPGFKQYFRNPVLFYKYIYPQLQVFSQQLYHHQQQQQPEITTTGIYDAGLHGLNSDIYNGQYVRPSVVRDNVDLDVLRRLQQRESFLPYAPAYPTTTSQIYGRENYDLNNAHYNVLLDKIYRTLFLNKQGEVTGVVKTDVKTLPGTHVEEQTVGKIVDPTTGEEKITTGDVKIVDEKVVKVPEPARELVAPKKDKEVVDTILEGEIKKEALLKKHNFLNKNKKVNTEDLKTIHLPLTIEDEYRIRRNPASLPKNIDEQEIYNPVVAALYARYGKDIFNKNFEGERFALPQTYNTREHYHTLPQEQKEFLPLEDKLNLYNPLLHKDIYYTEEIPKTVEGKLHKVPLTYQTSLINSGLSTFNPEQFKDIKA